VKIGEAIGVKTGEETGITIEIGLSMRKSEKTTSAYLLVWGPKETRIPCGG
jgi:hypothetical protein